MTEPTANVPSSAPGSSTEPRTGPWRLATPPLHVEHTHWSKGLAGFYLSCAGVALGATFASAGPLFFGSKSALVFGCVLGGVRIITCFFSLAAARRKPERKGPDGAVSSGAKKS